MKNFAELTIEESVNINGGGDSDGCCRDEDGGVLYDIMYVIGSIFG